MTEEFEYKQEAELRNYSKNIYGSLTGEIYNDKTGRFPDGTVVRTSALKELNEELGYAVTRNTYYKLVK